MAVFRVEKTRDYTVMANYHLRDHSLSLKAKGLLSLMLSLPDDWDFSIKGLARICKDGVDSVCSAVKELEAAGYIQRHRTRSENGRITEMEYQIYEKPIPTTQIQELADAAPSPNQASLEQAQPKQEKPVQDNPAQLNIQESITEEINKELSSTHSFFPSGTTEKAVVEECVEGMKDDDALCIEPDDWIIKSSW